MIRNTLIFLLFSNIVFGQNLNDTKINVSKKYNPSVTDANRLDDQAVYLDTIKVKNTFDYDFISMQIKTKPNIRPLKPALVKNQKFLNNNLNQLIYRLRDPTCHWLLDNHKKCPCVSLYL